MELGTHVKGEVSLQNRTVEKVMTSGSYTVNITQLYHKHKLVSPVMRALVQH